jgi:hypothetical protein
MFLPAGYPESVSEDYLMFQFWDTIQAMCSYLRGVLATQSVLESVGVGDGIVFVTSCDSKFSLYFISMLS